MNARRNKKINKCVRLNNKIAIIIIIITIIIIAIVVVLILARPSISPLSYEDFPEPVRPTMPIFSRPRMWKDTPLRTKGKCSRYRTWE